MQHVWGLFLDQFPYILNSTFLGKISGAILCMCLNSFSQNLLIWKFSSIAFCVDVMTQNPVCFMYHMNQDWPLNYYRLIFSTKWYLSMSFSMAVDKNGHIYYPVDLTVYKEYLQGESIFKWINRKYIKPKPQPFTLMSSNPIAEKRDKKFHPGESSFLSLPKEKFLSKYDYPSIKQTKSSFLLV